MMNLCSWKNQLPYFVLGMFLFANPLWAGDRETNCTDGIDNDGDTVYDCSDADCFAEAHCQPGQGKRTPMRPVGIGSTTTAMAFKIAKTWTARRPRFLRVTDLGTCAKPRALKSHPMRTPVQTSRFQTSNQGWEFKIFWALAKIKTGNATTFCAVMGLITMATAWLTAPITGAALIPT